MHTITTNLKYLFFGLIVFFALGFAHAVSFTGPSAAAPGSNVDAPLHTGPSQVKDGSLSVGTFSAYQDATFSQQVLLNGTVFGGQPGDASSTLNIGLPGYATNISANGSMSVAGAITTDSVKSIALCADASGTIVACTVKTPPPLAVTLSLQNSDASGVMGMVAQLSSPVSVDVTVDTTATYDTSMNTTLLDKLAELFIAHAAALQTTNPDNTCPVPMAGESVTLTIPAGSTDSDRWGIPVGSCGSGVIKVSINNYSPQSDGTNTITASSVLLILN